MNIWEWVSTLQRDLYEAGQVQNAQLIDDLSSHVAQKEIGKTNAALPEVKALAHTLKNPWLSVYAGHWEMRSRIGNQREGESALADVVELFEFAHREDTIDCPQSVCITQDLTTCYANIDGIGWADDRIAVCDETLARIDPTWNCYQCITCEKVFALLDQGKIDDALTCLDTASDAIKNAGEETYAGITSMYNDVYFAQGEYQKALDNVLMAEKKEQEQGYGDWKKITYGRALDKTQALAGLGRDDEALEALPPISDNTEGDWLSWLQAIYPVLLRRESLNTWRLARHVHTGLLHLSKHGSHRRVINLAKLCIELSLLRQTKWLADYQWQIAHSHLDKLRVDGGAKALLDDLRQQIDALPDLPLPTSADDLVAWLDAQGEGDEDFERNPEYDASLLFVAHQQSPDNIEIIHHLVMALEACQTYDKARELLWQCLDKDDSIKFVLLNVLLGNETGNVDVQGVDKLAKQYEHSQPIFYHWCYIRLSDHQDDYSETIAHCRALLALDESALGARNYLADALLNQKQFKEASEEYAKLYEADNENTTTLWNKIVADSADNNWQAVKQTAKLLELDNEYFDSLDDSNERFDQEGGVIIVRFEDNGETLDYYAERLGPAHARIVENARVDYPQHLDDIVVFHPKSIYAYPDDEEERQHFISTHFAVHTLQTGGYQPSHLIDGVHPSDDQLEKLKTACEAHNYQLWHCSGSGYTLTDSNDDSEHQGILLSIAIPIGVSPLTVHEFLSAQTQDYAHKLCWYTLAKNAGVDVTAQLELIERYGL